MSPAQSRAQIIQALELRLAGRPATLEALADAARAAPEFARAWLAHAIGSDAALEELAVALAIAAGHGLAEVEQLRTLWAGVPGADPVPIQHRFAATAPRGIRWPERNSNIVLAIAALAVSQPALANPGGPASAVPVTQARLPSAARWLDWLRDHARPRLQAASVYGQQVGQSERGIRDSDQALLPTPTAEPVLASIERLLCHAVGAAIARAEPMVVLRYRVGQQYRWHRDYIQPSGESVRQELASFGQRVHTGILYLNEGFSGGETEFRDWGLSLNPAAGTALGFSSIHPDGSLNPASVHRGAPVEHGEKWIATLWFRDRPIWARRGLSAESARAHCD